MAIIKNLPATKSLEKQLEYLKQEGKTLDHLRYGINCTNDNIIREFNIVKNIYNKNKGKTYYHIAQSFSPNDNITAEKAMILGVEWIEKCIEGYQIYVVTHIDKDHLHNHFVINSVSLENGLKLQISPQKLLKMKQLSNEICRRENLATINLESDTGISKCHNEYSLEKRCKKQDKNFKSLKSLIREKIDHAINSSNNFDNFKKFLFDKYNINTIENNSAIVFNDESINMKVSGRKLGGSFTKKSIKNRINNKLELKTD